MLFGDLKENFGQSTDSASNVPATVAGLDIRDDGKGSGCEFGITSIVGGKALEKLL
jgi:hypothetical protein